MNFTKWTINGSMAAAGACLRHITGHCRTCSLEHTLRKISKRGVELRPERACSASGAVNISGKAADNIAAAAELHRSTSEPGCGAPSARKDPCLKGLTGLLLSLPTAAHADAAANAVDAAILAVDGAEPFDGLQAPAPIAPASEADNAAAKHAGEANNAAATTPADNADNAAAKHAGRSAATFKEAATEPEAGSALRHASCGMPERAVSKPAADAHAAASGAPGAGAAASGTQKVSVPGATIIRPVNDLEAAVAPAASSLAAPAECEAEAIKRAAEATKCEAEAAKAAAAAKRTEAEADKAAEAAKRTEAEADKAAEAAKRTEAEADKSAEAAKRLLRAQCMYHIELEKAVTQICNVQRREHGTVNMAAMAANLVDSGYGILVREDSIVVLPGWKQSMALPGGTSQSVGPAFAEVTFAPCARIGFKLRVDFGDNAVALRAGVNARDDEFAFQGCDNIWSKFGATRFDNAPMVKRQTKPSESKRELLRRLRAASTCSDAWSPA